jgi:hypothetical protein
MTRITGFDPFGAKRGNKYHAVRTYVESLDRTFDSKGESKRAVDLSLLQRAGIISGLEFQVVYVLSQTPRRIVTLDFRYKENGMVVVEDFKGKMTEAAGVRYAWLHDKYGIEVKITKKER